MTNIKTDFRRKELFEQETIKFLNEKEYYFTLGQIIRYMQFNATTKSKMPNRDTMAYLSYFCELGSDKLMKQKLIHILERENTKANESFKKAFNALLEYTPENPDRRIFSVKEEKSGNESVVLYGFTETCYL